MIPSGRAIAENTRRYLGQKLGSVGTVIALVALSALTGLQLMGGLPAGFMATLAVFVMASGLVSRDASSGALQMILSRPVRRVEYLFGRFLGALALLALFLAVAVLSGFLLDRAAALAGWGGGVSNFVWSATLLAALVDFLHGALVIATLLFLSTFLRGMGDVLVFLLVALVLNILPQVGASLRRPGLIRAGRALMENLSPDLPIAELAKTRVLTPAAGAWVLALVGFLVLACLIFNRREFSYGTD
jgi:ABC-type transport system involved in multi-copper enzyme maturation permease subunit